MSFRIASLSVTTRFFAGLIVAFLPQLSCDADTKAVGACGDGFLDPAEACDGAELGEATCATLGYYNALGQLACNADCTRDTTDCGGRCGDGVIQLERAETCEGDDLAGETCESLGFSGGTLTCGDDCRHDTTSCESLCGNGVADPMEPCDLYDLRNTTCESLGYAGGAIACAANCTFDESACMGVCGDGLMAPDEACEGTNTRGLTCESLGFSGGALACTGQCSLDTSACEGGTTCGDGALDEGEACDTEDLADTACDDLGFIGGKLTCGPDCRFNTSRCLGSACGNGHADPGEDCDASDLDGATCDSLGLGQGVLSCASDCHFNTTGCADGPVCGNGILETGEVCDGDLFGADSCADRGFYDGTLACLACTAVDATACTGSCGDGVVDEAYGETCDGPALGTLTDTCGVLGYAGGSPTCRADCQALDYTACTNWVKVSTGLYRTCGVDESGGVWCWGRNRDISSYYLLGDNVSDHTPCFDNNDADCSSIPVRVTNSTFTGPLESITDVSVGANHTCALASDGTVWCWGQNSYGQLGNGSTVNSNVPVHVSLLAQVTEISCQAHSSCALTQTGAVWCWGDNTYGQLGNGNNTSASTRVRVLDAADATGFLSGADQIRNSGYHVCARKNDGTMMCWGYNAQGQLGDGTHVSSTVPVLTRQSGGVNVLTDIVSIGVGGSTTCAVLQDESLWCWGYNAQGQLGINSTTNSDYPVQVLGFNGLGTFAGAREVDIASHSCSSKVDGTIWCWGYNDYGQLGTGNTGATLTPVQVRGYGMPWLMDIIVLSVNSRSSCALSGSGWLFCWGDNVWGLVGDGTFTSPRTTPVPVHGQGE